MYIFLWLPRLTLGRLFRGINSRFDTMAADVEFLVEQWRLANNK